jgi:ABC-2 type transport system permease protein
MRLLDNSRHIWKVWRANARASVIREMEFRGNFFAGLIRQMLWLGTFILFINVTFRNTSSLSGWSQGEVLVILALSRLIEGTMNTLFLSNIMEVPTIIQKGMFDFHLTKPISVQLYTSFHRPSIDNIGNVCAGIVLLAYALFHIPTPPSTVSWLLFIALAFMGIAIFYSLLILVVSLVFYIERLEALWGFVSLFTEPLTVPFDVFPHAPRLFLTYVLPIAFIVFVPAQALTSRLAWWQFPVALAITLFLLIASNMLWRAGLRRYTSASS